MKTFYEYSLNAFLKLLLMIIMPEKWSLIGSLPFNAWDCKNGLYIYKCYICGTHYPVYQNHHFHGCIPPFSRLFTNFTKASRTFSKEADELGNKKKKTLIWGIWCIRSFLINFLYHIQYLDPHTIHTISLPHIYDHDVYSLASKIKKLIKKLITKQERVKI